MNSTEADFVNGLKTLLYYGFLPQNTYFEDVEDAPVLFPTGLFVIVVVSLVEGIIVSLQGRGKEWSLDIALANFLCGCVFIACHLFLLRGVELIIYNWVYNNMRIFYLPWNAYYTYLVGVLGVDFGTYWWHRLSHEIAILWAPHSTHHNAEGFQISFALRISSFVRITKWMHYLPLALVGVPPSIYVVHMQLNFLFATFMHSTTFPKLTKKIPVLGPFLEFIFMTPSNHRVHHGVNKYCIDKNYGFVFVIYDRMFGTYAEEREDEKIVYGTITQVKTFHSIDLQVHPYQKLFEKMQTMKTTGDKLRTLFYGPGWTPGKPRLGDEDDIPDVTKREPVKLSLPSWLRLYVLFQVVLISFVGWDTGLEAKNYSSWLCAVGFCILVSSCTSISGIHDSQSYAVWLEPLRLVFLVVASHFYSVFSSHFITTCVSALCLGSLLFWPLLRHHFDTLHLQTTSAPNAAEEHKSK